MPSAVIEPARMRVGSYRQDRALPKDLAVEEVSESEDSLSSATAIQRNQHESDNTLVDWRKKHLF